MIYIIRYTWYAATDNRNICPTGWHVPNDDEWTTLADNIISAQWDLELTNKDGIKAINSGVTLLTIRGSKVVQGEDFMKTTDGDDYKRAWGDIK